MNKFDKELLLIALKNYQDTGSSYTEFWMKNPKELYYAEAAEYLAEAGILIPLSDNIGSDSIPIPEGLLLRYELTDNGLAKAMEIKDQEEI